jgi:hypothetical protein
MRLSCDFIVNYANVNQFAFQDQWKIRAGDPVTLYFQLIDLDQPAAGCNCSSLSGTGLRYIAGVGLVSPAVPNIIVSFPSIDNSKVLQLIATQVSPLDGSIWAITLAPTQVPGSGNVLFQVNEGTATRTFSKMNAMAVELPGSSGGC